MPFFFKVKRIRDIILSALAGVILTLGAGLLPVIAYAQTDKPEFIADIPLMPNTELDTLRSVSFDTAGGRVLVLFVEMDAGEASIRAFYAQTLSALGWQVDGQDFKRRGEMLKLKAAPSAGENIWKVTLSPQPSS